MLIKLVILFVIVVVAILLISFFLHLIFRGNLTEKLWLRLIPGLSILVFNTYVTARMGGTENPLLTFTLLPISIGALVLNFFFVGRTIMRKIDESVRGFDTGLEIADTSASEVAQSSMELAETSNTLAASLEEISASIEELASMTASNAQGSQKADQLMQEVEKGFGRAQESMNKLHRTMEHITEASGETAKIIRTIDEIAFQTNLLALNAAVEAARAGEAGAGFAVVAEEVRNLALRSAEAARSTTALIENNLKNIRDGVELVADANRDFQDLRTGADEVAGLVTSIARASREQTDGIQEVNTTTCNMDKAAQSSASISEENAAAAQTMLSQVVNMKEHAENLDYLVTGKRRQLEHARPTGRRKGDVSFALVPVKNDDRR